jgi:hypothetical protein
MAGSKTQRFVLFAHVLAAVAATAVAGATAGMASSGAQASAYDAVFHVNWQGTPCGKTKPAGTVACDRTQGASVSSSEGKAAERYGLFVLAPSKKCSQWRFTSIVSVAGKGTLNLVVKSKPCVGPTALDASGTFAVSGGTGAYARASGGGNWVGKDGKVTGKDRGTATDVFHGTLELAD